MSPDLSTSCFKQIRHKEKLDLDQVTNKAHAWDCVTRQTRLNSFVISNCGEHYNVLPRCLFRTDYPASGRFARSWKQASSYQLLCVSLHVGESPYQGYTASRLSSPQAVMAPILPLFLTYPSEPSPFSEQLWKVILSSELGILKLEIIAPWPFLLPYLVSCLLQIQLIPSTSGKPISEPIENLTYRK